MNIITNTKSNNFFDSENVVSTDTFVILQEGSQGDAVVNLQQSLRDIGFYPSIINGIFDSNTKAAVIEFQRTNAMTADGVVEFATMSALVRCCWY